MDRCSINFVLLLSFIIITACDRSDRSYTAQHQLDQQQNTSTALSSSTVATQVVKQEEVNSFLPYIVSSKQIPLLPHRGDEITIEAEADHRTTDPVEIEYGWSLNGVPLIGENGPKLKADLKKGDRVTVVITPIRAGQRGIALTKTIVILNSPPLVRRDLTDLQVNGRTVQARVIAEDIDGDILTYALQKGPLGASIDSATGVLTWRLEQRGVFTETFSISVRDSDGAETIIDIPLSVTVTF